MKRRFSGNDLFNLRNCISVEMLIREKLNLILSSHTGQPLEKIRHDTDRDNFLGAEDAREYGLIDEIIDQRNEATSPDIS